MNIIGALDRLACELHGSQRELAISIRNELEAGQGEPVGFVVKDFQEIYKLRNGQTLMAKEVSDLHCVPLYAKAAMFANKN